MFFRNELLFNNAFLSRLTYSEEELGGMYSLVRTARDWYRQADFLTPTAMLATFIQPLLRTQSLDLVPVEDSLSIYHLVAPWDPAQPLGLLYLAPKGCLLDGIDLDGRLPKGQHWTIMAVDQAIQKGLRWVILTNGDSWRLLDAQVLRRYEAYLEINLAALVQVNDTRFEFDRAAYLFYRLFRLEGAFARQEETGHSGLDEFQTQALQATERTERYLKRTVCDYQVTPGSSDGIMAQLCIGLVRAVDPEGTHSFNADERDAIYMDATYLLYRLLFILYAEARGLLPSSAPEYQPVSLASLLDEALELRGDPVRAASRPTSLWDGLAALFNFIDIGDTPSHIPAFDGGLFDNRSRLYLSHYKITNTYLAEALCQLAFEADPKDPARTEKIDYCDLSVRHLGSLYEGMIEYRLFIAEEDLLARQEKEGRVRYLPAKDTPRKANDELVPAGRVYFAQSPHERKATGTHYTPEDLVARLVTQTVLRLLDERWQAFEPQLIGWLAELETLPSLQRQAAMQSYIDSQLQAYVQEQVLSLTICDPAMGSGHFLVHTAHQLNNHILQTLALTPWANPALDLNPAFWKQRVVESCLYGVDINPVAVELAKLSLWLASMQADRPLSFLDHHLKTGNSLLGVSLEEIQDLLETDALQAQSARTRQAEAGGQLALRTASRVTQALQDASQGYGRIAERMGVQAEDIEAQKDEYAAIQHILEPYKQVGDLLAARRMGWKVKDTELHTLALTLETGNTEMLSPSQAQLLVQAQVFLNGQQSFHWPLEFPQIFLNNEQTWSGFDVVIGNPPFLGGYKIRGELGSGFAEYLRHMYQAKGQVDLCVYIIRQSYLMIVQNGYIGMITTNTIGQGDTRLSGLAYILQNDGAIIYADRYVKWPGDATVEVNIIGLRKKILKVSRKGETCYLDGVEVPFISSWLDDLQETQPALLVQNENKAFIGDALRGTGFILAPDEARYFFNDGKNSDCIYPYLIGNELNSHPEQKPERFVICFKNWELEQAKKYPELLRVLEERVKPERDKVRESSDREHWWRFARYRGELRQATELLERVLARSCISETHAIVFVSTQQIISKQIVVFAFDDYLHFALIQSVCHEVWLRRNASTMRTDISYSIAACFDTFPFPQSIINDIHIDTVYVAQQYYEHRQQTMQRTNLGLTKTYNRFHDPYCQEGEIQEMRRLHADMDLAVLACYGWEDIDLQHDFYPNDRKKMRWMPSRPAQREIFTRLLALNQQIAAQEAAQGLSPATAEESDEDIEE